jgi:hypothetical protein
MDLNLKEVMKNIKNNPFYKEVDFKLWKEINITEKSNDIPEMKLIIKNVELLREL